MTGERDLNAEGLVIRRLLENRSTASRSNGNRSWNGGK